MYTEQELNKFDEFVSHFCMQFHKTINGKKTLILHDFNSESTVDMLFLNMAYIICRLSGVEIQLQMNRWKYHWFNRKSTLEFNRYKPSTRHFGDDTVGFAMAADREGLLKNVCDTVGESFAICGKVYEAYYKR